ncbi:hypothetical protein D3C75_1157600 [compost metagenome]
MPPFNQITTGHITAFEGVIDNAVSEVFARLAPVHDDHRNGAVFFQHIQQFIRIFRAHYQQAVDAFLRQHLQIGLLFLQIIMRVTQNQRVAFGETAVFNGFNDFGKVGRFT